MHPPVRALSKGLRLLAELNSGGPSTAQNLSRRTSINRTTVYRLLETLSIDGYVAYDEESGLFSVTPRTRGLSDGLTLRDASSQAAFPPMFELMREIGWPSDFGVFDNGFVTIRESTHPYSPFSIHRAMIGKRRSLLRSALGRAILAAADEDLRRGMLEIAVASAREEAALAGDRAFVDKMIEHVREMGYAYSVGETEHNISAIALPIFHQRQVVGSLNIIFFRNSLSHMVAAERFLAPLSRTARTIEERLLTHASQPTSKVGS